MSRGGKRRAPVSARRGPRTQPHPKSSSTRASGAGSGAGKGAPPKAASRATRRPRRRVRSSGLIWVGAVIVVAIGGLLAIFATSNGNDAKGSGKYAFQVGNPGPGQPAPAVQLPATTGGTFDLASLKGQKVLLYFQEGIGCQPCWDQIKDIEKNARAFQGLGINRIVSITTDPLDSLRQKVADEGLSTPVLSDPDLRVSKAYDANRYGMMGTSRDGHSFVLVDEQGMIVWRGDYGGAPDFTMYVPPSNLLADLRKGTSSAKSSAS